MVDDYGGYKALFQQGIVELGCMAHARRKFFELHAAHPHPTAAEALSRIGELYAIETEGRDLDVEGRRAGHCGSVKPSRDCKRCTAG